MAHTVNRVNFACLPAAVAIFCGGGALGAPPLVTEDTVDVIIRTWSKVESISAVVVSEGTSTGNGAIIRTETTEQYQYVNKEGRRLYRVESTTRQTAGVDEKVTKTESKVTIIGDGDVRYEVREESGKKVGTRSRQGLPPDWDVPALLHAFRRGSKLSLLPDAAVVGHPVYVIRATPRESRAMGGWTDLYFAKDSGVLLKSMTFDRNARVTSTRTVQSFKLNVEIPADRFVF